MISPEEREEAWVVVEPPGPGDAKFVSEWLSSAVEADRLLVSYYSINPAFLPSLGMIDEQFAPAAMAFVTMWLKDLAAFPLNLNRSEFTNSFANMAAVGFFTLTGDRYQMTVPKDLKVETITNALLQLAATEDVTADFDYPHPEWLVSTMTQQEALEWVRKLNRLTWQHRVADRDVLLAE